MPALEEQHSPLKKFDYDAIVIGTGPGGEGAAMKLTKAGKRVAVIEKYRDIGGGCTHWGTIPSKALRHSVTQLIELKNNALFNNHYSHKQAFTFADVLRHTDQVIAKQVKMRSSFYERNHCTLYFGTASFVDKHHVQIKSEDGSLEVISASNIIIATGSRPYHPHDLDFNAANVYDSDTILSLNYQPQHIVIYGAGVIGCEYASIFRGLGVKTDLVNTRDRLLSFLDAEMSDALSYHFRNSGMILRHDEAYQKVESSSDGVVIYFKSGKKMKADCLLYANGRTGNTDLLNLQAVALTPDGRGQLTVNDQYQTTVSNIYAVGDVIGYPSLASAAYDQGRIAARLIISQKGERKLIKNIPTGIYTIPEISSVGKTEQMLTQQQVPYEVGRAQFKDLARSQILGSEVGSLKILFHRESKEILGIHCFGERAAEIIHIGQAIMEQEGSGNTIEYFVNTTFNYPTMAEAYRVAALNGLNRLF